MITGRPSKYEERFNQEIDIYIKEEEENRNLPTIQGLALYLNVNQDTLFEWAKIHKEFSESLDKLKNLQAKILMNKGLRNEYNPTIAKLILSANHGMRERTDITTNDKDLPQPLLGGKALDSV